MSVPTVSELGALLGRDLSGAAESSQAEQVLAAITTLAFEHTRGRGFTNGVPNVGIRSAILTASARYMSNPTGLLYEEARGPESVSYRSAFNGWTLIERVCLDRYRVTAL